VSDKPIESANVTASEDSVFAARIGANAMRKQRAQRSGGQGVWFGLGMSGLIGWSVAVPTVLGAVLGLWLDARHPKVFSWTLSLLFVGLVVGCFNAWHWVAQQSASMRDEDTHG
jgi:ATP synthase protein I